MRLLSIFLIFSSLLAFSANTTYTPNVFGGYNGSDGSVSRPNVFGGMDVTKNGKTTTYTPNVFGGYNGSDGSVSTPNVFGGMDVRK